MQEVRKIVKDKTCLKLLKGAISTTNKKGQLSNRGVPQGLSISNRLANIMLFNADQSFLTKFGAENYFRYVDDILLITKNTSSTSDFWDIAKVLKKAGLSVHSLSSNGELKSKSQICSMTAGVEYLGFNIKLGRVSVRKASLKRMYDRIAGLVTSLKYGRARSRVTFKLDLMISGCILNGKRFGWLHFFQQTDDVSQLVNLDKFVRQLLSETSKVPKDYKSKSFVKAYHEIKFNATNTKYVPNFDEASLDFKKSILTKFANLPDIDQWTIEEINAKFFILVSKMARELEQDILEPTS
jgi:RNA-directed DNA polymerase